jgi:phage terminase large subunit
VNTRPVPKVPFAIFAYAYLNLRLYDWQNKILIALERKRVSAVVCNGGGKSNYVIPAAVLAFLYNWPAGRVKLTSGSFEQVRNIIWPAIEKYSQLPYFKGWKWTRERVDTPQKGFAEGFSTDKPESLEGAHHDPDRPVLYIIDEAKALDDSMYDHINRCTPTFYMQLSSACPAQGYFYASFNKLSKVFWTIKVDSKECPHITDEQREIDAITLDPKEYAMKHHSEFSDDLSGMVITMTEVTQALERQVLQKHNPGQRTAFCDFAAGGAENVIALRDGNKVELVAAWRNPDPTQACREFVEHFKRLKLHPSEIFADVGGMGVVMCSNLKDLGWPVTEVNNGLPAQDEEHYANRGAEIWFEAAKIIRNGMLDGRIFLIPNDKLFLQQLTDRKREYDLKNRLKIESKKDLSSRRVLSPDRADAILGAMVCKPSQWNSQLVAQVGLQNNVFKNTFVHF